MLQIGGYGLAVTHKNREGKSYRTCLQVTKIVLTNNQGKIVVCLYVLDDGNLHPDSWLSLEGKEPDGRSERIVSNQTFNSFRKVMDFVKEHPEAENDPLLAFRGCRLNLPEKVEHLKVGLAPGSTLPQSCPDLSPVELPSHECELPQVPLPHPIDHAKE